MSEFDENIKLPISLSIIVAKELRDKYGIDKWKDGTLVQARFTKEELSKIKELKFTNPNKGDLVGIEKLPELKSLSLESNGFNEFLHPDARKSIDDADITSIEKCANLETLSIINQPNITEIDLSRLTKLDDINISNNMNLESIHGIDKLQKLSFLTCYGNKSLQDINGLDRAVVQNKENLSELNLDVLLFPKAIKYNCATGSYSQEASDALERINNGAKSGLSSIKWCENISNFTATKITHGNMLKMHNEACRILNEVCPRTTSVPDMVVAVERYLAENVTYDYDGLAHGFIKGKDINIGEHKLRLADGIKYGTNSAFDCLIKHNCICEGYTRGEQYLLALKGIQTRNVACVGEKDTMGMADHTKTDDHPRDYQLPKDGYHSIIYIGGYYGLYSDPCWNACRYQQGDKTLPYSLLTKEEMGKDHMLSFEERAYTGSVQTVSRSKISESIGYNTLFRNSRASEVTAQKGILQQNVVGIVRGADGRAY
ncbi:MAG: leucine-rich repeat domain-containing protein [Alphaproteobacteria bacterium]|nr:leucine-rich repeat domain-containing protein [Alphaproteobacteria bacterium]